jgi:hypothetical protein
MAVPNVFLIRLPLYLLLGAVPAHASRLDNEAGQYVLDALPAAAAEARRMDRMELSDQQPAGRHVRRGESLTVTVGGMPRGHALELRIGFLPMWGSDLDQQVQELTEGSTRVVAEQSGPIAFVFSAPEGSMAAPRKVTVRVAGGQPLPLYVDGHMDADDWADELARHPRAPFVQLIGVRAMITLPAAVHARAPVDDPVETFAVIDEMLDLQDQLAGLDGSTPRDRPSPLRVHYLVDSRASARDREGFYMYATDGFVGMLDDNFTDLTDPDTLREAWGIWHETGHTQQQHSWTWESFVEVNVNLFSLYVQDAFGAPDALTRREDGAPSWTERARDYRDGDVADMLDAVDETEESGYFIRLVMLRELQAAYGWELYTDLHKYFRRKPLPADASDRAKADAFIIALCALTGEDLRPYLASWGLVPSARADRRIDAEGYAPATPLE